MTLPLRRKRPTTARGSSTSARTAFSVVVLLLTCGPVLAQGSVSGPAAPRGGQPGGTVLYYGPTPAQPASVSEPVTLPIPGAQEQSGVRPVAWQASGIGAIAGSGGSDEQDERRIQLEPPGPERLFRLESEARLKDRIRQEGRLPGTFYRVSFPEQPPAPSGPGLERHWAQMHEKVEPNYVCYKRLYFEEKNSERYGWDLGILQPFVSLGHFYFDTALLPYKMGTEPCRIYDSNAGYCLPGDPVPYQLYPLGLSLTGLVAEGATVTGLIFIFP
jgi:hypothetical protein